MPLEASALAMQGILDAMPDMLRVLDIQRRVVLANKSYEEHFGAQAGRQCFDMFCAGGACRNCVSARTMATGVPQDKRRRHMGRTYWVKASPLFDSAGKLMGAIEVFRDVTELDARERALRMQNKRLLQESNTAARMQRALFLPDEALDSRVSVSSRYLPASSLGGDLFGCFLCDTDKLCFYIADVAGHGMAAAMMLLLLANAIREAKETCNGPAAMLSHVREAFLKLWQTPDAQRYVTMFVAELSLDTGRLLWANAGHNAVPLLVSGKRLERLYAPALPICDWAEDITYSEQQTQMQRGDRLLLYTDGLIDAHSSALTERMLEQKMLLYAGEALLAALERKVLADRADDVCMLLVSRAMEEPGK